MIKIILVDDHQVLLDGIASMLDTQSEFQIVGKARDGKELLSLLLVRKCDVVLLDISMPNMDGIETAKALKALYPSINILCLTTHDEPGLIAKMIENGALGYILKNCSQKELSDAVYKTYRGEAVMNQDVADRLKLGVKQRMLNGYEVKLTKRELEVLKLIAEELTTSEIAEKLFLSQSTIESHRRNLFLKLDAKNAVGLVKRGYQLNFI